jgi:hypothetical protein
LYSCSPASSGFACLSLIHCGKAELQAGDSVQELLLGGARPDFLDRAVIVEFLDMQPEMRRDEAQFWREFKEVRPRILGALLDAVVAGLGNLRSVTLDQLPRMADFAIWVSACERALGLERGEALEAYRANCAATGSPSYKRSRSATAAPGWPGSGGN